MTNADLLPRRLSAQGAVAAGTKLKAHCAELQSRKIEIAPKLQAALNAVHAQTDVLAASPSSDASMNEIDRGADRCLSALDGQLEETIRAFDHEEILPLEAGEAELHDRAEKLRTALFPSGTGFVHLPYSRQWAAMKSVVTAIQAPENAPSIAALGLGVVTGRVVRWFDLYGDRLGITSAQKPDVTAQALDAWHKASGTLVVHARATFDGDDEASKSALNLLLSPYELQADSERQEEVRAKKAKKARAAKTP